MSEEKQEQNNSNHNNTTEKKSLPAAMPNDNNATVVRSLDTVVLTPAQQKTGSPAAINKPLVKFVPSAANKLAEATAVLLSIAAELRRAHVNIDLAKLRQSLTLEINAFNLKAKNNGIADSHITLARYVICAVLDEFVLDTPWGANSNWSDHSLLSAFHHDSAGGAKVFAILEKIQQDPAANLDLLELIYTCLTLGFLGKYRIIQDGQNQLATIKQNLYQKITSQRGKSATNFAPDLQLLKPETVNKVKRIPILRLSLIIAGALLLIFIILKLLISIHAQHTTKNLRSIVIENTSPLGERVANG